MPQGMFLVEEHCDAIEAVPTRSSGGITRENAGMSSEKEVGILLAEFLHDGMTELWGRMWKA